ncbi:carbon-nitrogen hydrolase family protein [Sciscionella marina]|uniref:carbon-nitrogen hydrolase family protein n=1 Tax=Sciscionella marina TaxID=508770 RepID=UPI00036FD147|nr:nitrilase-related carbon-nitrogen hydrolase [Sciscionella marina]
MSITVAVAQFTTGTDKESNRKLVTEAVHSAAESGAELVITPESSMYADPEQRSEPREYAEPLDGEFTGCLTELAADAGIAVLAGFTELLPGRSRASNTLVAIGSGGERLGVYRKLHLYDAFGYRESERIEPAEHAEPLVFGLGGLRVGAMTCYDLRFPEMARSLTDAGANAIAVPAAWVAGPAKEEHWSVLARARAIENTSYVLASGQTGPFCTGQSMIVDPMGSVLAGAGEQPGIALARLHAERVERVRATNPSLANRRFAVIPAPHT